jgi:hypothetical protein
LIYKKKMIDLGYHQLVGFPLQADHNRTTPAVKSRFDEAVPTLKASLETWQGSAPQKR